MRPVNLDDFVDHAASALSVIGHEVVGTVLMVDDDEPHLACLCVGQDTPPDTAAVDQLFAGHHDYAAMATLASWAPNDATECGPSWVLVAVTRDLPASFTIGRIEEQMWYRLSHSDLPWFAAASAGGLRGALEGHPLPPFRRASDGDPRLFGKVADGNVPPSDELGRI